MASHTSTMYVRTDRQRLKDGTERRYLSLAHNVWVEGPTGKKRAKPVIFARLGTEEDLDLDTVRSMRDAFDRYLQKRLAGDAGVGEVAEEAQKLAPTLRVLASREYGMRLLVGAAWKGLGLDRRLKQLARRHDIEFDFERIVFGMVLNRLVDPQSKRACNEWLTESAWFPEADEWGVHHFYRAMDLMEEHEQELLETLQQGVRERLSPDELELLLIDTTSSYFESDFDDVERAAIAEEWAAYQLSTGPRPTMPMPQVVNQPPVRLRGHSKDHRPDKPQVVIGVVGTLGGRLLWHNVYPGNKNDQKVPLDLVQHVLDSEGEGRPVVVLDSGTGGGPNLAAIDAMAGAPDRVSAVPLRNSRFAEEKVLSKPGRWRVWSDKPHFSYRVVELSAEESPSGRAELWIATRNAKAADRAIRKLERHLARVTELLDKDDRLEDHNREVCKLLSHRTLKRYVRPSKDGRRLLLDRDRIRLEKRRAGVKLVRSTLVDKEPVVSLRVYQGLLDIEDGFRTFKTPLRLRPMHHRAARRIRAHVLMCAMAMACMRELEEQTQLRFDQLRRIFSQVQAIQMQQGQTRFWQRSEWPEEALPLLEALGLEQGHLTWGSERVEAAV